MRTIGVIPARYASTRFPAKVLALIGGKPLIRHVWQKACQARELDQVIIACDHPEVYKVAHAFGADVRMTDPNHPSGSDRIAQVVCDLDVDIIVNIQGDEPFIDPGTIDALSLLLKQDKNLAMGTVIKVLADEADFQNPNVVKCVVDDQGYALYFSRSPIPYNRSHKKLTGIENYKHLGLYAYRKDFLMTYKDWPKGKLESVEELEQLRVLERGIKIKTTITAIESIAVDTPEDLVKAEQWYAKLK